MANFYSHCINTSSFILDLLLPKFCVGCSKEGEWICPRCQEKIVLIKYPTCPKCARITKNGQFCPRCRKKSNISRLIVAAYYQEGPLKEAIHTFKYDGVFDLSKDLGKILVQAVKSNKISEKAIFMPVPLHKRRKMERGFNQSELLAKYVVAGKWALDTNNLIRNKITKKTQAELSGQARRQNVKNIFSWRGKKNQYQGKTIILVDDVYTTGATLEECAKVLRKYSGASKIWALVLAKV